MKKFLCLALGAALLLTACGCGEKKPVADLTGEIGQSDLETGFLRTTATDDFGRSFSEATAYNDNAVGIFYFLWLNQAANDNTVEKYIAEGRGEETVTSQNGFGAPTFTWWGEPMYGYYQVEDVWVVRKHVELFINAGLDFICFDTTNNSHYAAAARTVLNVLLEYEQMGYKVPKAMFMTNSDSPGRIKGIYNDFYRRDTYDSVWFTGNGDKPWILGSAPADDPEIMDRFYFKKTQWPNMSIRDDAFPWISWKYPQESYYDAENGYDIMSVSVSQHVGDMTGNDFSLSGLCSPQVFPTVSDKTLELLLKARPAASAEDTATYFYNRNWGRGYSQESKTNDYERALANENFEEQWQTVYENGNINLVFVTGWNEWIAQRQTDDPVLGAPYGHYIDTFDMEFSRDIEMMNGGYLDNCYLQLVKNVRTYKGGGTAKTEHAATDLDMTKLVNWEGVPAYADLVKETEARNHMGAGENFYRNDTGRNDIREVRVAADADNLYFLVTTVDDITPRAAGDSRYMNLWLGFEGRQGGFNGLQYVVNRSIDGNKASVEKIENGSFSAAGEAEVTISGKYMLAIVPKSAVGVSGNSFGLRFKATDNLQKDFDVADLYTNGDAAPIGRINYSYYAK